MELTGNTFFFPWEVSLEEWLQNTLGSTGTSIISFFSAFGEEIILILVLGVLYWWFDKKTGKRVGLSALAAMTWNAEVKNIFLRRRPYMDHEGIKILRVVEPSADPMDIAAQGYSFPSGHSANASSVYASLAFALKKKWMTALAVILPLLSGPRMLMNRNLLYTAVTRAKRLLIIIGTPQKVEQMVVNNRRTNRYSCLRHMLEQDLPDR